MERTGGRAQPSARRSRETPFRILISLILRRRHRKPFPSPRGKPAKVCLSSLLWMPSALNPTIQEKRSRPSASPFLCAPGGSSPTKTSLKPLSTPHQNGGQKSVDRSPFRFFLPRCFPPLPKPDPLATPSSGSRVVEPTFRLGIVGEGPSGELVGLGHWFHFGERKKWRPSFCAGRPQQMMAVHRDGGRRARRRTREARSGRFLRRLLWRSYCVP